MTCHRQLRAKYITIRTNTDDRKDHFKQCFYNKHVFDQLDTNVHIHDPNYNYEILNMRLKKLIPSASLNVESGSMTKNIRKLLG